MHSHHLENRIQNTADIMRQMQLLSDLSLAVMEQQPAITYYAVTVRIPMGGKLWTVGYYKTEALARQVVASLDKLRVDPVINQASGLNILIDPYSDEIVQGAQVCTLKNAPNGAVTVIEDEKTLGYSYDAFNPPAGQQAKLAMLKSNLIEEATQLNSNRQVIELEMSPRRPLVK